MPHLVYVPFPFDAEQRHWHSTFVVDITDTIEQKLEAIRCYESQFDAERFEKVKHLVTLGERLPRVPGAASRTASCSRCRTRSAADDLFKLVHGGKGSLAPVQLPGKDHLPMN